MNSKEALARRSPQVYVTKEYKNKTKQSPPQRRELDNSDLDVNKDGTYLPQRSSSKKAPISLEEHKIKKRSK